MACAQCGKALTRRQITNHAKYCSRGCYGLAIRLPLSAEQRAEHLTAQNRAKSRRHYRAHHEAELERARRYREANREKVNAASKRSRLKNMDSHRELVRRWRDAHPDYHREWAEANRDKMLAYGRAWRKKHPDQVADKAQRRRALKRSAARCEKIDRGAIYERDRGICHICRRAVAKENFTLDHLVPLARGGDHVATNLCVAHLSCNSRRGAGRLPAQLLLVG